MSPFAPSFSQLPHVSPRSSPLSTTHHASLNFDRPLLSYTSELPLPTHRFAGPAFSSTYESLFWQLLCSDNHLRRPLVFSVFHFSTPAAGPLIHSNQWQLLCSHCYELCVALRNTKPFGKRRTGARVRLRRRWAPVGRQGSVLPVERFHAWCYTDVRTCSISRNPVFPVAAEVRTSSIDSRIRCIVLNRQNE